MIETERLLLRPPILDDFEPFALMRSDFERSKMAGGGLEKPQAWTKFMTWVGAWQCYGFGMFSVIEKQTGNWIGNIGPVNMYDWPGQEFGWALIEIAEGRGFAQEACLTALDWSFRNTNFDEFVHSISPQNIASEKLAKRIGAYFIGEILLPPPYEGEIDHQWKSFRKDWESRCLK